MRAHEVPTHVQAEDRVAAGAHLPPDRGGDRPLRPGPTASPATPRDRPRSRTALAVVFGLAGMAMIAGRIGGRALPLVAGDLLRFGLGPRRYAGPPSELVRSEPPPPAEREPGPVSLLAERARRSIRRLRSRKRKAGERRNGPHPLPPPPLVRQAPPARRRGADPQGREQAKEDLRRPGRRAHGGGRHPPGGPGRRPLAGRDRVRGPRAGPGGDGSSSRGSPSPATVSTIVLRAAIDLELRTRVYGGAGGRALRFWAAAALEKGERIDYDLPLSGDAPSITFAWEDALGHAGALTLEGIELPYPLPSMEGELCTLRIASLGWSPGSIEGVVAADCAASVEERVALRMVEGGGTVTALMGRGGDRGHRHPLRHRRRPRARRAVRPQQRGLVHAARADGPGCARGDRRGGGRGRAPGSPCRRWSGSPTTPSGPSTSPRR